MTARKRSKRSKARGSWTHGHGGKKRSRGAGNRGGRGLAGSGKRADQNKTRVLKKYGSKYFGKKGFKIPQKVKGKIKSINIEDLNKSLNRLLAQGQIKKDTDITIIDLKKLGYDKLLGKGKINQKLKIIVPLASKKAIEKIKEAGGEITNTLELKK